MSFTACVRSKVVPFATKVLARSGESFIGRTRLKGCEFCMLVPNMSCGYMEPTVGILP